MSVLTMLLTVYVLYVITYARPRIARNESRRARETRWQSVKLKKKCRFAALNFARRLTIDGPSDTLRKTDNKSRKTKKQIR